MLRSKEGIIKRKVADMKSEMARALGSTMRAKKLPPPGSGLIFIKQLYFFGVFCALPEAAGLWPGEVWSLDGLFVNMGPVIWGVLLINFMLRQKKPNCKFMTLNNKSNTQCAISFHNCLSAAYLLKAIRTSYATIPSKSTHVIHTFNSINMLLAIIQINSILPDLSHK